MLMLMLLLLLQLMVVRKVASGLHPPAYKRCLVEETPLMIDRQTSEGKDPINTSRRRPHCRPQHSTASVRAGLDSPPWRPHDAGKRASNDGARDQPRPLDRRQTGRHPPEPLVKASWSALSMPGRPFVGVGAGIGA